MSKKETKKAVEAKNAVAKDAPKGEIKLEDWKKKRTKEEIEALLKAYKEKNPVKYALKEENGEFKELLASAK